MPYLAVALSIVSYMLIQQLRLVQQNKVELKHYFYFSGTMAKTSEGMGT
jgi:hypothetical protein